MQPIRFQGCVRAFRSGQANVLSTWLFGLPSAAGNTPAWPKPFTGSRRTQSVRSTHFFAWQAVMRSGKKLVDSLYD